MKGPYTENCTKAKHLKNKHRGIFHKEKKFYAYFLICLFLARVGVERKKKREDKSYE